MELHAFTRHGLKKLKCVLPKIRPAQAHFFNRTIPQKRPPKRAHSKPPCVCACRRVLRDFPAGAGGGLNWAMRRPPPAKFAGAGQMPSENRNMKTMQFFERTAPPLCADKFRLKSTNPLRPPQPPPLHFYILNFGDFLNLAPPAHTAQTPCKKAELARLKRKNNGYERAAAPKFQESGRIGMPGFAIAASIPNTGVIIRAASPGEMKKLFRIFTAPEGPDSAAI